MTSRPPETPTDSKPKMDARSLRGRRCRSSIAARPGLQIGK